MYIIRKKFKFEMAHQLSHAYSDCCSSTIHGHSYILEVFFKSAGLDDTGMVIDFGEIKDIIQEYIDKWDHALVMPDRMPAEYLDVLRAYNKNFRIVGYNPTAENMAVDMFDTIKQLLPDAKMYLLHKIRLHETSTGWAEYKA